MKQALLVVAALVLVGCTGSPAESPSPTAGESQEPPAPTSYPSEDPDAEPPVPTAVPSRDLSVGGALTVWVGGEPTVFQDVQCDTAQGLDVVASSGDLSGVNFRVRDDAVTDVAVSLPDGLAGIVGGPAGEATFTGDATEFELQGQLAALTPETPQGDAMDSPFRITGSCEPGQSPSATQSSASPSVSPSADASETP